VSSSTTTTERKRIRYLTESRRYERMVRSLKDNARRKLESVRESLRERTG